MSVTPQKPIKEVLKQGDFVDVALNNDPTKPTNAADAAYSAPKLRKWRQIRDRSPTLLKATSTKPPDDVSGGKARLRGGEDDGLSCEDMCFTFFGAVLCWLFCCEELYE